METPPPELFDAIHWDAQGLVAAIAQDHRSGQVLMLAWMNREALAETLASGYVHYWSRTHATLWKKGETSGHLQRWYEIRLDCDGDALLLQVEQTGGIACHTGRASCFFHRLEQPDDASPAAVTHRWRIVEAPLG